MMPVVAVARLVAGHCIDRGCRDSVRSIAMRSLRSVRLSLTLATLTIMPMTVNAGYVRGYMRRDGTYVEPHYRNPPGFGSSGSQGTTAPPRSHSSVASTRDPEERRAFVRTHPCPSTGTTSGSCPGYVVGYVVPLKHGGADEPYNMRWRTVDPAKAKTK
jgi:hypothetical protein